MLRFTVALFVASLVARPAFADDKDPSAAPASSSARVDPVAVGASIVPGALAHGSGHFANGNKRAASSLFALEAVGLGATGLGLGVLAASGASRRLVVPSILVTASGVSLFFATWLSDVYGVSVPDDVKGAHPGVVPVLETSFGYRYVHDPQFRYRNFVVEAFDLRLGSVRVSPEAWLSPDDGNERLRGALAYRIRGPKTFDRGRDGSFVEVESAALRHGYPRDGFSYWGVEAMVTGRLDLVRIAPTLKGAFAEASFGYGLQSYEYGGGAEEADDLLLFRALWGVYVGRRGEAFVIYDHRHDGYAGGFLMSGLGSGVIGSVGLGGRYYFTNDFGVALDARVGAAQIAGLSLLYRPVTSF